MTLGEIKNLKMWDNIKFEGKDYYVVSTYGAQGNAYGIVIEDGASGKQKYLKEKDFRGVMKNSANSCASSNPVVQNALKACNADEYVVRKSLSTSKWLLSRRSKSLGDSGETKVFGSEQEARDFARKNGLKVVNAEVVENEDAPMKRCRQDLTKAQEYLILAKQSIRPTMHDNAQEWFYEIDGIAKEVSDLRKRIVD